MIYALTFEFKGFVDPGGSASSSQDEIIKYARSMAEIALDHFEDALSFDEWCDLNQDPVDPRELLKSDDPDELKNIISQISDALKADRHGYIDLWEYNDLFELIKDHEVPSWCDEPLKSEIATVRKDYFTLMHHISDEWSSF
jgi:hypothetical protein